MKSPAIGVQPLLAHHRAAALANPAACASETSSSFGSFHASTVAGLNFASTPSIAALYAASLGGPGNAVAHARGTLPAGQ